MLRAVDQYRREFTTRRSPGRRVGTRPAGFPNWPRSGDAERGATYGSNGNTGHILDHVLAVTFEYTPSNIRMLSTDKDVTAHVGAWIVVSARRIDAGTGRASTQCPRAGCPPINGVAMNNDRTAKIFYAGHMCSVAVLVNVLIDK